MNRYPKTPHWPTSPALNKKRKNAYVVENLESFLNTPVVVTEKIDGCNTKICRGEVTPRDGGKRVSSPWLAMTRKHHAWKTSDRPLHFWGEDIYGIHSIKYDPVYEEDTFYLFNVTTVSNPTLFLSWGSVESFAENLNVKTVPVLFRGEFSSVSDMDSFFDSAMGDSSCLGGKREGLVIRKASMIWWNELHEGMAKLVRQNHVKSAKHWRKDWKKCRIKGMRGLVNFDSDSEDEEEW